jgi:hypothetical protein
MSNDTTTQQQVETPITADELLAMIRTANARLPIVDPIDAPADTRRRLGHVSPLFSAAAVNAIGSADGVAGAIGMTDVQMRQVTADQTSWNTVIEELRALVARTENSNLHRRQRIGLASLQTLHVCRQIVRNPAYAVRVAPHLAELERLNTFATRRKGGKTTQPQTPQPTPEQHEVK